MTKDEAILDGVIRYLVTSHWSWNPDCFILGSLPIGAPKATLTPAAEAADKISRFFASFLPGISNFEYKYQLQRKMLS